MLIPIVYVGHQVRYDNSMYQNDITLSHRSVCADFFKSQYAIKKDNRSVKTTQMAFNNNIHSPSGK